MKTIPFPHKLTWLLFRPIKRLLKILVPIVLIVSIILFNNPANAYALEFKLLSWSKKVPPEKPPASQTTNITFSAEKKEENEGRPALAYWSFELALEGRLR